jgi:hypothetical protein
MVDSATRARIASGAVDKAKRTERDAAGVWRDHGFPEAERRKATGFKSPGRERADKGDLEGTGVFCVQVKSGDVADREVPTFLAHACEQAVAAGADYAVLVVRRFGKSDPRRWWTYMTTGDLVHMLTGEDLKDPTLAAIPQRMEQHEMLALANHAGYAEAAVA